MGECVLVDGVGVIGFTRADWESICGGMPKDKVWVIHAVWARNTMPELA